MPATITASLQYTSGGTALTGSKSFSFSPAGALAGAQIQPIGTTTEALDVSDIAAIGAIYLENQDATNFIEIGITTPVSAANAMITLRPGEAAVFPTRLEVIYAKSDTAICNLFWVGAPV